MYMFLPVICTLFQHGWQQLYVRSGGIQFFWGHGYYGNEWFFKKNIRLLFYRIADYHFLYGNRARKLLINMGFNAVRLFTVYNSLDYRTHKMLYANKDQHTLLQLKKNSSPIGSIIRLCFS